MINWTAASRCLADLQADPARTSAAIEAACAAAPCYQNTEFPLSALPLYIDAAAADSVIPLLERYVALLGRIVTLYREHQEVRDYYRLGPAAESLIRADTRLGDSVPVCRLDGYLEQSTERLMVLENNADAPAGTLFSTRVNHTVQDGLRRAGVNGVDLAQLTLTDETVLLELLLELRKVAGLSEHDPRLAILQFAGRANRESHQMAQAFQAAGVYAVVADPRDIELRAGAVWFGAERIDFCWNKVNTVGWRTVVEPDPELVGRWARAVAEGEFVHVNPFGARYIAESKFSLALPREQAFAELFSPAEHELVQRLLPWGRRLTEDARAEDGGTSLLAELREHGADYVIKQPYDIRGDGVTVGRAVGRTAWDQAVDAALAEQLVAQRYVAPTPYPVLQFAGGPPVVAMPTSLDTFLLGGRARGFGSKASLNPRLNVFQGGQKLAVHVS